MSIGVAILGGGIFAKEAHLPAVQKAKDLTLRAVYSRSLKSAQSLITDTDKVDLYSDDSGSGKSLDDLLSRSDIKGVIIALPIKNQPDYVRKALLAGKHVLSEKPIAENVQEAAELIQWYDKEIAGKGVTWGVAENARFWDATVYAGEQRQKLGKALTFRARQQALVEGGKYFETDWRKVPTHQGGFLLDGGVHFVAALRLLLGKDDPLVSISAFTAQLQKHLPPVDTIEAVAKTKSGAVGSISISFGTTASGTDYHVGSEKGFVSVAKGVVKFDDKEQKVEEEEGYGVPPEVRAWGEGIAAGKTNVLQSPKEALADLEIIESCLRSGEAGGKPIELKCQQF